MKEQMTYVAIDTDDVGESIGNAVLENDDTSLSSISQKINQGTQIFASWAEYNGGEVISSGSDEAIFKVPVDSIQELERLKGEYKEKTGFTVSIGIGGKISDAAKALIYAKMNGKDQIIDHSPEIEMTMKQNISGELNEQVENEEDKLKGGVGDDTDKESLPQDELEQGIEHEKEHTDDEEIAEEIATDHLTEDDDYYSDLEEMEDEDEEEDEETEEIEVPADQVDGDYGSEEMEEGQPEHEKDMSEEEEFIHDAEENREDEADKDLIEADEEENYPELVEATEELVEEEEDEEEAEEEDEALDDMAEAQSPMQEDIDLDGRPDAEEEHGPITPEDDLDGDGDVEHEEAMASSQDEEYDDEGDYEDEYLEEDDLAADIENEMSDEEMEEDENSDMDEMDMSMLEEMDDEEEMGEEDHEELKRVIFESLQSFKENRQHLEQIKQENPDLYTSLIHTLQAMVEMARELGYGNMDEMSDEEVEVSEEDVMGDAEEEMPIEEEEFEKAERVLGFIQRMRKGLNLTKSDDKEQMSAEEIKEAIKKKIEAKKKGKGKGKGKKRKPFVKKPKGLEDKKKKQKSSGSNEGSFCAKSHKKMRAAGKDCRANEDKDSPLCSARKKMNCRGKNEEKGPVQKSEKLANFLGKQRKK